ncbi:hypothetical protein AB2D15_33220 [Pseudomonas aeruginosa]
MDQTQCNELRDRLFAAKFDTDHRENMFRYLAVLPGEDAGTACVVHFAYAAPRWERAGQPSDVAHAKSVLHGLIEALGGEYGTCEVVCHPYLVSGWPIDWALTAKHSSDNFPTLVLMKLEDGRVAGALMRDPKYGNFTRQWADRFVEPDEVGRAILGLQDLKQHDYCLGLYMEHCVAFDSLEDAIEQTPQSPQGQKAVLIYQDDEWLSGIWNNPSSDIAPGLAPLTLTSVSAHWNVPASAKKLAGREGLDGVREHACLKGSHVDLQRAIELLSSVADSSIEDFEQLAPVKALCEWWNRNVGPERNKAGAFQLFQWDYKNRQFNPCSGEPHPWSPQAIIAQGDYALFEAEGLPTLVAVFSRGRAFNVESEIGTQTFLASGHPGAELGLDLHEVDEAVWSYEALRNIRPVMAKYASI